MGKPLVLVVDDDDDARELERWLLEDAGYYVVGANDGGQALQILEDVAPAAVVTDIVMPGIDGRSLYHAIRANDRLDALPVLFVTSLPQDAPSGPPVLAKPFSPDALVAAVRALCPSEDECDELLRHRLRSLVDPDSLILFPLVQWAREHRLAHAQAGIDHRKAGEALRRIIADRGWPTRSMVGRDGASAAWRIVYQDLADPDLMRRCLPMLEQAARARQAALPHAAMLLDRIRFFEGREQVYGTQYGWDAYGAVRPWPIENASAIDERRRTVGLIPIRFNTVNIRRRVFRDRLTVPGDVPSLRRAVAGWATRIGWRSEAACLD